jgi:hypothetical protein
MDASVVGLPAGSTTLSASSQEQKRDTLEIERESAESLTGRRKISPKRYRIPRRTRIERNMEHWAQKR